MDMPRWPVEDADLRDWLHDETVLATRAFSRWVNDDTRPEAVDLARILLALSFTAHAGVLLPPAALRAVGRDAIRTVGACLLEQPAVDDASLVPPPRKGKG